MCASKVSGLDHLLIATSPLPAMKKQVTFAENQKVNSEHPDSILPRLTGIPDSNSVFLDVSVNSKSGLRVRRPLARHSPQHEPIIHIRRAMTSAPFLKNAELTPAQKEYLYTIAESYSAQHVRNLITQHYMNVLHRCIRTDNSPERDSFVVTPEPEVQCALENETEVPSSSKQQTHSGAKHAGKSKLSKIHAKRQGRSPGTPTSKHRNTKRYTAKVPGLKKKTKLKRSRSSSLWDDLDLDIEEGPDDSLSECLSLLSIGVDSDSLSSDV